jgi:hypothetical protein
MSNPQPYFNPTTQQWELPQAPPALASYAPPPQPYGAPPAGGPRSRIDELRAQMIGAQVTGRGSYFPAGGRFRVRSKLVKYQRTIIGATVKESIVAEFAVEQSSAADVPVGSTKSVIFSFKHDGWLGRFKALVLALSGHDPDMTLSPEATARAADVYVWLMDDTERQRAGAPPNFLSDIMLDLETFPGTSRNNVQIVNLKWSPVRAP